MIPNIKNVVLAPKFYGHTGHDNLCDSIMVPVSESIRKTAKTQPFQQKLLLLTRSSLILQPRKAGPRDPPFSGQLYCNFTLLARPGFLLVKSLFLITSLDEAKKVHTRTNISCSGTSS